MITQLEIDHLNDASTFLHELAANEIFSDTEAQRLRDWSRMLTELIGVHENLLKLKKLTRVPHKSEDESDERALQTVSPQDAG
jgi:hypothetical protein